jgi:cyclohexanecarboxylate-CoA ligase
MTTQGRSLESRVVTLWELLEERVSLAPRGLLFVDEAGQRVTFTEFRSASLRMADGLKTLGIGAGTVVSWILPTSIDAFVVMAALSRLSAVQNPIVPIYGEREIGHIIDEASVEALIVAPRWRGVDYVSLGEKIASARGGIPRVISLGDIVDGSASENAMSAVQLAEMEEHLGTVVTDGDRGPAESASGDAISHECRAPARWLFYTSGSTVHP